LATGFSSDFKELVRARIDIVELVGESVSLQARHGGQQYVALCPFHDDHTPSLTVSPERQSYKCWVCDEGGDCFSWVMKTDMVGFREALETLSLRAHLELPKQYRQGGSSEGNTDKNRLYEILAWAENEFHRCLMSDSAAAPARNYLKERGFTEETVRLFRAGYHPDDWNWLINRARGQYTPQQLFAARLVRERREGSGYYDDFVDRVMFPIRDFNKRVVAFGGRVLPENNNSNAPKYLNSPESIVFAKSRLLYGLDIAREAIQKSKTAVVVEGYTDCMMAQQYGLGNVVGTLGTALTETHVKGLKRFAEKVVLVYDGDVAGQNAAERALPRFLAQQVDLRILTLPSGLDPADYLSEQGADAFRESIENSQEAWDYKLHLCLNRYGVESLDSRDRVLNEMLELLSQVPDLSGQLREGLILGRLSQRLGVAERSVREKLKELRKKSAGRAAVTTQIDSETLQPKPELFKGLNGKPNKHELLECELLEIIFTTAEWIGMIRQEIDIADFQNPHLQDLLQVCFDLAERGIEPNYERVTAVAEDSDLKRFALQIDEWAKEKKIAEKLNDNPSHLQAALPVFVEEVIQRLNWRREEHTHELSKAQTGAFSESSDELNEETRAHLQRVSEFHGKRVRKKTTT
jgi:DNA primase